MISASCLASKYQLILFYVHVFFVGEFLSVD